LTIIGIAGPGHNPSLFASLLPTFSTGNGIYVPNFDPNACSVAVSQALQSNLSVVLTGLDGCM
jgi:hypothetical protein